MPLQVLDYPTIDNSSDTIYGVLNGSRQINEIIKRTQFENLDIITSNVDLSGLEVETG
jgi:chromosome partitioning protein